MAGSVGRSAFSVDWSRLSDREALSGWKASDSEGYSPGPRGVPASGPVRSRNCLGRPPGWKPVTVSPGIPSVPLPLPPVVPPLPPYPPRRPAGVHLPEPSTESSSKPLLTASQERQAAMWFELLKSESKLPPSDRVVNMTLARKKDPVLYREFEKYRKRCQDTSVERAHVEGAQLSEDRRALLDRYMRLECLQMTERFWDMDRHAVKKQLMALKWSALSASVDRGFRCAEFSDTIAQDALASLVQNCCHLWSDMKRVVVLLTYFKEIWEIFLLSLSPSGWDQLEKTLGDSSSLKDPRAVREVCCQLETFYHALSPLLSCWRGAPS